MKITLTRANQTGSRPRSDPRATRPATPARPEAPPRPEAPTRPETVHARLTEGTFSNFLDGFQEVLPEDLLEAKGGRVRYVVELVDAWGSVIERKYRLGGWLAKVDPGLRYLRLFNPYAKKSWSVQLRTPGSVVRLYYMPPGTSDEVATLRNIITQVENGKIRITKAP